MKRTSTQEPSEDLPIYYPRPRPPVGAIQSPDPMKPWFPHPTLSPTAPTIQNVLSPGSLGYLAEHRAADVHHLAAPPPFPPSEPEARPFIFCGGTDPLDFPPGQLPHVQDDPYPQEDAQSAYLYHHRTDHFHDEHIPHTSSAQFSSGESPSHFFRVQDDPTMTGGFSRVDHHSPPEPNYDPDVYHGGRLWTPGFEETCQPHPGAAEPQPRFYHAQLPPAFVHAGGHASRSPPHPVDVERKQTITYEPAESSSMGIERTGIESPGKRKRETTPDDLQEEGKKRKRVRRKKPRDPQAQQEYIPANPFATLATQPDLRPVEQIRYQCDTQQKGWEPRPPIGFTVEGNAGISLVDAKTEKFSKLDDRDESMFTGGNTGGSISLRMAFVGHQVPNDDKARQIATTNYRSTHDPITRQKLARGVAKLIESHLKKDKTPFRIPFERMFLVRLHNVSQSSWQPEIWYSNSASTSS